MPDETVKRDRGGLENLVLEVCNQIESGGIASEPGKAWTPHRLAVQVAERFPGGAAPSTGAISDNLKRWRDVGFAEVTEKPLAFVGFTPEAKTVGLAGLKEQYRNNQPRKPRATKPLVPSGSVTLEKNPGQAQPALDDEELDQAAQEQQVATEEVQAQIPTPADALEMAEEATEDHDGQTVVIEHPDGQKVIYHDDAEYAQGDPHPNARDDEQHGWTPRDEWDEHDQPAPNPQGDPASGGEFRDQRSIELDSDEFTDQPSRPEDDPFAN
jgi:hypothetical protein